MWVKCGTLDPAVRLLHQTAWIPYFYSRNTLLLPTVAGALPGLKAAWKSIALTARGVYPQKKGCHSSGNVARCGGAEDWPECYLAS